MKSGFLRLFAGQSVASAFVAKSGSIFAGLSQIVAAGGSFVVSLILIKQMGIADFGRFTVGALLIFVSKNFAEAIIFAPMAAVGGKLAVGTAAAYRGFMTMYALFFVVVFGLVIGGGLMAVGILSAGSWLTGIAVVTALSCTFSCASDFTRRKLFLERRACFSFFVEVVRYTTQLIFIVGWSVLFDRSLTVVEAIGTIACSSLLSTCVGLLDYGQMRFRFRLYRAAIYRHWGFIKWMIPSVALDTVHTTFPFFYASGYLGATALGLMRAAHQITAVLNMPFNALMQIIPTVASRKFVGNSPNNLLIMLRRISFYMVIFTVASGFLLLLFIDPISKYLKIYEISQFGILIAIFCSINAINAARFADMIFVNTVESTNINFFAALSGAIIGVSGALILTPLWGIYGVTLTFVLVAVSLYLVLRISTDRIARRWGVRHGRSVP